jgi:hypothetical protein
VGGLNALSSKSDGDAADFLDRPADQERRFGRGCGRVFLSTGVGPMTDDATSAGRKAVMGALSLYLNFINLFMMLLRPMGGRR